MFAFWTRTLFPHILQQVSRMSSLIIADIAIISQVYYDNHDLSLTEILTERFSVKEIQVVRDKI